MKCLAITPILIFSSVVAFPLFAFGNPQSQNSRARSSQSEAQALSEVQFAKDAEATLERAKLFVKNFPSSESRAQVVDLVVKAIEKLKNGKEAVPLAEDARRFFNEPSDQDMMSAVMLDSYARANMADEAFKLANQILSHDPNDLRVLIQMSLTGTEQAKKKNRKFVQQALQAGIKAISIIESDKKPAVLSDSKWIALKPALAQLYQQTAILNLIEGNSEQARARLIKASTLDSKDPYPVAVLGHMMDDEYAKRLRALGSMPVGEQQELEKKKIEELLDNIIDTYARTVALAMGRVQYLPVMQQTVPSLTRYYIARHNSTEGLQQLIDKHKP